MHAPTQENAGQWAQTIADHVTAEHGDEMRLDIHVSTPAADAEVERLREQLAHAEAELTRLHDAESADAAAGSYAGRAEEAEAAIARVRALANAMSNWCSPHGVATDYAARIHEALNPPTEA
ncbi:hypothetical protein [Streptomyces sp. NPDC095613]|uniref:hypothetical protein n=1 Tax=Streptomyces sp. NPDC095613 TaxID=3155540 RepID=UPI00333334CC